MQTNKNSPPLLPNISVINSQFLNINQIKQTCLFNLDSQTQNVYLVNSSLNATFFLYGLLYISNNNTNFNPYNNFSQTFENGQLILKMENCSFQYYNYYSFSSKLSIFMDYQASEGYVINFARPIKTSITIYNSNFQNLGGSLWKACKMFGIDNSVVSCMWAG